MNHESLSIPEDSEVWCELEERQYQKFKARLIKELFVVGVAPGIDVEYFRLLQMQHREVCGGC